MNQSNQNFELEHFPSPTGEDGRGHCCGSSPSGRLGGVGRTELAQRYFPYIQPQSAWQKLRSLLADDPDLAPLTTLKRRSFLPAELNQIYNHLGNP